MSGKNVIEWNQTHTFLCLCTKNPFVKCQHSNCEELVLTVEFFSSSPYLFKEWSYFVKTYSVRLWCFIDSMHIRATLSTLHQQFYTPCALCPRTINRNHPHNNELHVDNWLGMVLMLAPSSWLKCRLIFCYEKWTRSAIEYSTSQHTSKGRFSSWNNRSCGVHHCFC